MKKAILRELPLAETQAVFCMLLYEPAGIIGYADRDMV